MRFWCKFRAALAATALGLASLIVGADPASAAADPAAIVDMTNNLRFAPETVTVTVGDTVEWRNSSRLGHTVTADVRMVGDPDNVELPDGAEPFNARIVRDPFRYTFNVAGVYRYVCLPHERAGMLGTVIVEPAS